MNAYPNVERSAQDDMMPDLPGAEDEHSVTVTVEPSEGDMLLEDGSMIIDLGEGDGVIPLGDDSFVANLAEQLPEVTLALLAQQAISDAEDDESAREDWERLMKDGLGLLGLKYEVRTSPWQGASGVHDPMLIEAVVRFQSETIMETFPSGGPVLTKIIGKDTRQKTEASNRVRADMNHTVTERMTEFRDEHDRMLFNLPAMGCAFKKAYYDAVLQRPVSMFVSATEMLLPYGSTNVRSAPRATQIIRYTKNDITRYQDKGFFLKEDMGEPTRISRDTDQAKDDISGVEDIHDERFTFYEQHVELDLEGLDTQAEEGPKPYVLTVCKDTGKTMALRRGWRQGDGTFARASSFVQYDYVPGIGPYGLGLFHLIGAYARGGTSILRQLIDAGTLANLPGGLKAKGLRIKGDDQPIRPGEFRDVDVGGGTVRDNIMPLPYKEPSAVLAALRATLSEEARRIPGTLDLKVGDMSSQAPVGTTLALIERQLKVMTAVQARTHKSLKEELGIIKRLVVEHEGDKPYTYDPEVGDRFSRSSDYAMVEIVPVSDPSAATMTQRMVQYQAAVQLSQQAPDVYDRPLLHRTMLEVIGIKNADKLVPLKDDIKPTDPVAENMRVLKGEPIKAFRHQDHAAHIAVHQAAMQDPVLMQAIGQNPQAQTMMAQAQAHIAEHVGYMYQQQIEADLGVALPPEGDEMPPEVEVALAGLMARAAQRLLQRNQQQAAQQQAEQQAQDPVLQLQMREADRKDKEVAIKEQLAQAKIAGDADRIRILEQQMQVSAAKGADELRLREQHQTAQQEIAEQNTIVNAAKVGVMGRAQDQTVLQGDREAAFRLMETMRNNASTNNVGESRNEQ
jgi:chaperonin GroES